MPCNADYMEPNHLERLISEVACFLEELNGVPINKDHFRGYHPMVYNKHLEKNDADRLVSELCSKLQKVDVTKYSLAMQNWWREHKEADKERIMQEIKKQKTEEDRQNALSKLTDYEKKLLNL